MPSPYGMRFPNGIIVGKWRLIEIGSLYKRLHNHTERGSQMSTEKSLTLEDLENIPLDWRRDERAWLSIQLEPIRECVDAIEKVLPEYKKEIDKRFLA